METKERGSETENELRDINTLTADSEGPALRRPLHCELEDLRQDIAEMRVGLAFCLPFACISLSIPKSELYQSV